MARRRREHCRGDRRKPAVARRQVGQRCQCVGEIWRRHRRVRWGTHLIDIKVINLELFTKRYLIQKHYCAI